MSGQPAPAGELAERLDALSRVVQLGAGRLPADELAAAERVLDRARARRGLSADHTVVALAGATGSGKSSLFNALSGVDLSTVGARRPTTGDVHACVWGLPGATELLDWLEVPEEHRVARDTVLDTSPSPLAGLVLLDLPDHDSTDPTHRAQVDRLVGLVDAVVWVMDPQKYADRVVHEEFLRPMAAHTGVLVAVLNQIDQLDAADGEACRADLRRLLADDGLQDAEVVATSTTSEPGVTELYTTLMQTVQSRQAATRRLLGDVVTTCRRLYAYCRNGHPAPGVESGVRENLVRSLVDYAGVGTLGRAVAEATRRRGVALVGWPVLRVVRRFRASPAARLPTGETLTGIATEQPPAAAPLPLAQVDDTLRRVSGATAADLPPPWPRLVAAASRARADELVDVVDRTLGDADTTVGRPPAWCRVAWLVQWLSVVAVLAGVVLVVVGALGGGGVSPVLGGGVAAGGLVLGILLDLAGRAAVRRYARRRAERLVDSLRGEIARSARHYVIEPVEDELDAYTEICRELAVARGS